MPMVLPTLGATLELMVVSVLGGVAGRVGYQMLLPLPVAPVAIILAILIYIVVVLLRVQADM